MEAPLPIVHNARKALYLDPRWQKKRLEILSRDNFTCQECESTDKTLHVHHTFYWEPSEGPWDYPDDSLVTLCDDCHSLWHDNISSLKAHIFRMIVRAGYRTESELINFIELLERAGDGTHQNN